MQDGGGSIIFNYHEAPLAQDENAAWKPQLFIYLPHTHEIPVGLLVGNTLSPHSHQYSWSAETSSCGFSLTKLPF